MFQIDLFDLDITVRKQKTWNVGHTGLDYSGDSKALRPKTEMEKNLIYWEHKNQMQNVRCKM